MSRTSRGTVASAILASASRTTTQTQADQISDGALGIIVTTDVTVNAGGLGSITVTIQGKDANGIYYPILASAALVAVATNVLIARSGLPDTANSKAAFHLPRQYRVLVTANNANPVSYSVATELVYA